MDVKRVIAQMTLEEKAGLLSGLDFWHTKPGRAAGRAKLHGVRRPAWPAQAG